MPTIGNAAKPGGSWHAYGGSSFPTQEAELLEAPVRLRLLELGAWIGGWADTPRVRLCVWDAAGVRLGQSAQFTVANEGGGGPPGSNVALYTELLETPVELPKGAEFYCGFARHPDDSHQVSTGASGTGPHYHGRSFATWPGNLGERPEGISTEVRRIGAYVADYDPIAGAKIYRSGAWVDADAVLVYRSGVWVEADSVQVRRGAAWVDAE